MPKTMNSKLNKVSKKCLCFEQNTINPIKINKERYINMV